MKATKQNLEIANRQVRRLMAIDLLNDAQLQELSDVALAEFPTPKDIEAAISLILQRSEKVPTPAQLRNFARSHHRKKDDAVAKQVAARQRANPNCGTCSGFGQVYAWHLVTYAADGRKESIERITWEQYQNIGPKLDKGKQRVYELPVPCGCTEAKPAVSHQQQTIDIEATA